MGTCTQIVDGNKTIDKMLADSLSIYDQALYFIRQDFFKTPLEERDICDYNIMSESKLNALVKNTKAFKESDLDYNVKQQAAYQARDSFVDWKEAMKEYRRNPADFTGEPSLSIISVENTAVFYLFFEFSSIFSIRLFDKKVNPLWEVLQFRCTFYERIVHFVYKKLCFLYKNGGI